MKNLKVKFQFLHYFDVNLPSQVEPTFWNEKSPAKDCDLKS